MGLVVQVGGQLGINLILAQRLHTHLGVAVGCFAPSSHRMRPRVGSSDKKGGVGGDGVVRRGGGEEVEK